MNELTLSYGTYKLSIEKTKEYVLCAIKCGYRYFDTAQLYKNQKEVGEAIREAIELYGYKRSDFYVQSKIHVNNIKNEKSYEAIESIIKELNIDYVDCILLHCPVNNLKNLLAYENLIKFRDKGLIKYIGVSNYNVEQLEEIIVKYEKPFINQIEISIFYRNDETIDFCKKNNIHIQAHSIFRLDISDIEPSIMLAWILQNKYHVVIGTCNYEHINNNYKIYINIKKDSKLIEDTSIYKSNEIYKKYKKY
jgi:2,5-diketo-D-gluconate reductase A